MSPDNLPLTNDFVCGFLFQARFMPGFREKAIEFGDLFIMNLNNQIPAYYV